jgi:SPP1 gp7 family putative phage head morphogenesis protein
MQTSDADILTKKKQEWADKRKPEILRGTKLSYNASLQDRYFRAINALVLQMAAECEKKVLRLFEAQKDNPVFATDDSIASQAKILTNQLTATFQQLFERRAQGLAESMVSQADRTSSANLHESLKTLSGGLSLKTTVLTGPLKEVMKASVTENVKLISSISQDYLTQMTGAVMRSITTGNGLQDLVPFFQRYKGVTIRRARLIANDQTKKVYGNLNAHRMQKLGLDKYEWLHSSGGAEPRELHQHLNGKICSLSDPPIIQYAKGNQPEVRGKPGDLINCRCTMRPVIDFNQNRDE